MRLRAEEFLQSPDLLLVLWKTSPRGPPTDDSHAIGIQFPCLWFRSLMTVPTPNPIWVVSCSHDSLSGEAASFSDTGDDVEDMKSEVDIGMEIERRVWSDCRSMSGMN